jgi:hypothetical protein
MLIPSLKIETFKGFSRLITYCFSHRGQKKHFFKIEEQEQTKNALVYPNQYPKNIVDAAPLVPRGRPVRFITPKY